MRVIDPGHCYGLLELDAEQGSELILERILVFVKREGEGYPGNVGHHSGTTLQEVLRACFDRLAYLDGQIPDERNSQCQHHIAQAIHLLECRAADRHGRQHPTVIEAVAGKLCPKCGHVQCSGICH